ncbi:hypothetical protein [Neoroseomonas lacus]|uniref:RepB-like DNA primase domain-containing protein n=1 Tax=Neoroseomonas lacus TaxID=287609 RepID=A0A917L1H2_9PROT|nr:hypothetical protein [Neoroseomonas lacus]GGJ40464.1 hypothetical protein GCM10011320_55180 [Neoroseomonas lacus]
MDTTSLPPASGVSNAPDFSPSNGDGIGLRDDIAPPPTPEAPPRHGFTFGLHNQNTAWTDVQRLTWDELFALLTKHSVGAKVGTCIVPAVFRGTRRHKSDADQIDVAFLDSDTGATLEDIETAIAARGWSAIISSTHSHLASTTTIKRGNWDKFRAGHDYPDGAAEAYLIADKGYLPAVADGATVASETSDQVTFQHQPCPKFRIAIPLERPWRAESYDSQAVANAAWKERIEALACALNLRHDQSCTDTSRLFYLPRRPVDGPPAETAVLEGSPCDLFALPPAPKARRRAGTESSTLSEDGAGRRSRRRGQQEQPDPISFTDPETGEIVDLRSWARDNARRFEIVTALQARKPDAFIGKSVDGKHHLRCVNAGAHTTVDDDQATFVMNASQSDKGWFVHHCRHSHCDGRDHLLFLKQMLEQRWLSIADLTDLSFLCEARPTRPTIRHIAGQLPWVVDQAEQALLQADLGLYQRGAFIVRTGLVRVNGGSAAQAGRRQIIPQGDRAIGEAMTGAAIWLRFDGRSEEWVNIDAPLAVATTYLQRVGRWRLPVLAGILNSPTLRPDGTILAAPGYDAATGLLLEPRRLPIPMVPEYPTQDDARIALSCLNGLIDDFPFVSGTDRAVALSAILTAVIRWSLPTAPLHAFDAPVAGSGKSKLVDIATLISTGQEAAVIAQGRNEEELEKRLGALLLAGERVVAIDNCEAPLGGQMVCQMLTQTSLRMRILGRSEMPELSTCALVTATGNNLTLIGDMTRRAVLCRLDPNCERPELRRFSSDPVATLLASRAPYLVAALTVLRAFHVAGRPRQVDPLGSFVVWSDWVRGALIWLGQADPVASMESIRADDPRLESITAVLTQWWGVFADRTVTVRQIIEFASEQQTPIASLYAKPEFIRPDFREALLTVAGAAGAINSRSLGRWIAGLNGRVIGRWRLERGSDTGGVATWCLSAIKPEGRRDA